MAYTDAWTSYSDTTVLPRRVITDVISMIDPTDAPGIERLGGLDGAAGKFNFLNFPSTKYEWLEDTLPALTDTLGATVASNATAITVADASIFHVGHIINVGSTPTTYWVSARNTATNALTVATIGGTDASHASTDTVAIIGMARLEGADSSDSSYVIPTSSSNVTQIWHEEVRITRNQRKNPKYGIQDQFEYEESKKIPGLMRQIERHMLMNSVRSLGSSTAPRITGGLGTFISTNKITGTSLVKSMFDTAVKSIYQQGGSGELVAILSPTNYAKVAAFYDSSLYLRVDRAETTVGMTTKQIITPFGNVTPLLDRWATNTEIYIIDPAHAGWITYDPFTTKPLPSDGDYVKEEIIGEFGFCLRQEKVHAVLTAVS